MTAKYVLWDLDNCLSDDGWRMGLIDWDQLHSDARYEHYHKMCDMDHAANYAAWCNMHGDNKGFTPLFLTARPEWARRMTIWWISERLRVRYPFVLMRKHGDVRPSWMIKAEMVEYLKGAFKISLSQIVAAFDDNLDVVRMYESFGIPAHRIAIHNICAYTKPQGAKP